MNKIKTLKNKPKLQISLGVVLLLFMLLTLSACSSEVETVQTAAAEPDANHQPTLSSPEATEPITEHAVYGNTSGNISNDGLAVESSGMLYYVLATSGMDVTPGEIIRRDSSGELASIYSGLMPKLLNAVDGRLYFTDSSGFIYTIAGDGSDNGQATCLGGIGPTKAMVIRDGCIYCISTAGDMIWGIYKFNIESGEFTELTKVGQITSGFVVSDHWIYYSCGDSGAWSSFRISINGGEPEKVADVQLYSPCMKDGKLYYLGTGTRGETQICVIDADGTNSQVLGAGIEAVTLNSYGEWLYYSDTTAIYRMKADGTEQTKLCEFPSSFDIDINIVDGWMYIFGNGITPFRVSTDGGSIQELA